MAWGFATGVGSLPGSDFQRALELVRSELPEFPHIPELPARGPWFDMVGRGCGSLVEISAHHSAGRWVIDRPGTRAGGDIRRARAGLNEDVERFCEFMNDSIEKGSLEGELAALKMQVCGPMTLASAVELSNGQAVLSDKAARQDLAASLAEGVGERLHQILGLIPASVDVVLQIDEPAVTAVMTGAVPTASGLAHHPAVAPHEIQSYVGLLVEQARQAQLEVPGEHQVECVIHSCAADLPIAVLAGCGATGISLDLTLVDLHSDSANELGDWLSQGQGILAGVELSEIGTSVSSVETAPEVRVIRELMGSEWLVEQAKRQLGLTPRCGLATGDLGRAGEQYRNLRKLQRLLNSGGGVD